MGTRCADHVTPLYPQKLALTSPTGGGRSVGIVRVRTKATEFSLVKGHKHDGSGNYVPDKGLNTDDSGLLSHDCHCATSSLRFRGS